MYICIYIYSYMFDIFLIPQISTQLSNSTDNISISATGSTGTGVDTEKAGALVLDSPGFKKRLLHLPPKMGGKNEATFFLVQFYACLIFEPSIAWLCLSDLWIPPSDDMP